MLRVSFHGRRNEMNFPLGEICPPTISGLPKKSSLSISGASPRSEPGRDALGCCCCAKQVIAKSRQVRAARTLFISIPPVETAQLYALAESIANLSGYRKQRKYGDQR